MSHVIRLKDEHGNWIPVPTIKGEPGDAGRGIVSTERTSGTGAPGTVDTYTITYTDGTTGTFQIRNGSDGMGAGDMTKAVYDANGNGIVDNAEKLGGELPEHYAEADHSHGLISNDGKLGTTADLPVFTGTGGAVGTKTAADALTALGAAKAPVTQTITLLAADWTAAGAGYSQIVDLVGMRSTLNIIVSPDPDDFYVYTAANTHCAGQSYDMLSFIARQVPTDDMDVNVLIVG